MRKAKHATQRAAHLNTFSHPDYTVGSGVSPDQQRNAFCYVVRGLGLRRPHRRSGIVMKLMTHPAPKVIYLSARDYTKMETAVNLNQPSFDDINAIRLMI